MKTRTPTEAPHENGPLVRPAQAPHENKSMNKVRPEQAPHENGTLAEAPHEVSSQELVAT
ncbi:MAG: hypothetical protein VXZ13_15820 [Pseudomonadota bacterium]|nr:hypothetical protein [Pseudomonadota bacterium]